LFTNIRDECKTKESLIFVRGSVATQLKCGGMFNNYFFANCSQYVPVKDF